MNYWIFQSKPKQYDLRLDSSLVPGRKDKWDATRWRTEMHPGDLVYFWMAGPPELRGIYGWGRLTSEPYEDGSGYAVKVKYERKFPEHIPAETIGSNKELQNLMILKIAVGTNFLIDKREANAIAALINESDRPEVV